MIIPILSLPGEPNEGLVRWVQAMLSNRGIEVHVFTADAAHALIEAALTGERPHALMVVTSMRQGLAQHIGRNGRPFVYLHADPVRMARRLGLADGNHVSALRETMRRMSGIVAGRASPDCLVVDGDDEGAGPALLDAVLRCLPSGGSSGGGDLPPLPLRPPVPEMAEGDEVALMYEGSLGSFRPLLVGQEPERFVVSRLLFNDAKQEAIHGTIDVTGRAQLLAFGPYIYLPAGRWRARLVLGFSHEVEGAQLLVDVAVDLARDIKTQSAFTVATAGRQEVTLDFAHDQPMAPIEFRIFSQKAIFDGRMALGFVEVTRHQREPSVDLETTHELMREQLG